MKTTRRRSRRAIPQQETSQTGLTLIKVMISGVVLTLIFASQCTDSITLQGEDSARKVDSSGATWVKRLIAPRELQLPKSVLDRAKRERPRRTVTSPRAPTVTFEPPPLKAARATAVETQ